MSERKKLRVNISADVFSDQVNEIKELASHLTQKIYEGADMINAYTLDGSKHLENGIFYTKIRPSIIEALAVLDEKLLLRFLPLEVIQLLRQRPISPDCFSVIEDYTRQILIDYIGQVFLGPVRIVVSTDATFSSKDQIEFLVEMYQFAEGKERLNNRIIVILGKRSSLSIQPESLDGFALLQRQTGYDLTNLSYNSKGVMTIAAMLDNQQERLGLAMEWITGIFFYRMKKINRKAIMVRQANYQFSRIPILEPWDKQGFIIDTYVKKGYTDGIRLDFLQVIYRERTGPAGKPILSIVGIGFRQVVFFDMKSKRPAFMKFIPLETILKQQKKKKKIDEDRLRVQESVEKALNMPPKKFWESFWPESWSKKNK